MQPAYLHRQIQRGGQTEDHVFFGYRLPYLIDFLRSYEESSGPDLRKAIARDVLAEQVQFLRTLHGPEWQSCSFELRILNDPRRRRLEFYLLAKAATDEAELAFTGTRFLSNHIEAAFPSRLYPIKALEKEAELAEVLDAGSDFAHVCEYRRFEEEKVVEGMAAYVAYPLHGAEDSLQRLVNLMAHLNAPAVYTATLRPAHFSSREHDMLARAASLCRENERKNMELFDKQRQTVDVQAGLLADLYEHYLKSLQDPFQLRISLACPDGHALLPLLSAVASDVSRNPTFAGNEREFVNHRGEFCLAERSDRGAALFNLRYLEFVDWTPSYVQEPLLPQLRHLVDAVSANAAFRLPIPSIGGLAGIDLKPPSLFHPLPDALLHPGPGAETIQIGTAHVNLLTITKHALVAGTIGSGKTTTVFQLLHDLWTEHGKPFLVIEPVNAEHNDYRALGRYMKSDLRVFTLGDEGTSPLRLNPFHVPDGAILNAHIAGLVSCFLAALPFDKASPLPALFREGIRNIYFARGWFEQDRGGPSTQELETPLLTDLRDELAWLIEQRYGKGTEVAQNMTGASVTRVNALINSSAGAILLSRHSVPLNELFERPTIIELRHLGSDEDKALMTGFLLLFLQEYCDKNRSTQEKKLNHVVVLEEAHNLMQEVEDPDSPKAAAVKFFTNMLAENRKYGQAFVVVEQIPTLLAQGAIKNTVTKIMHRMPGLDDIELMGGAMNFKERHQSRAVCLEVGEAFLYTECMAEATLVPLPSLVSKDHPWADDKVREVMALFQEEHPRVYARSLPFAGCNLCPDPCRYRTRMARHGYDRALCGTVMEIFEKGVPAGGRQEAFRNLAAPLLPVASAPGLDAAAHAGAAYCLFTHLSAQQPRLRSVPPGEMLRHLQEMTKGD